MFLTKYEPGNEREIGDMAAARQAVLSGTNRILWHLVKSRYEWMNQYIRDSDEVVIEIGAGMGVAKEFIKHPSIVLTDVIDNPWIDKYLDAMHMDLEDNSVDVFICNAVIHHFASPYQFIQQAAKKLKPGGRILLLEPYTSVGLRLGNRIFKLEGWDEHTDVFDPQTICNNANEPWSANVSVPKLMFGRGIKGKSKFESTFQGLRIRRFERTECLIFALSGGVNWRVWSFGFREKTCQRLFAVDRFLIRLCPSMFAMACRIVVEKNRVSKGSGKIEKHKQYKKNR